MLYQVAGLAGRQWGAFVSAVLAALVALKLPRQTLHVDKLVLATAKADGD